MFRRSLISLFLLLNLNAQAQENCLDEGPINKNVNAIGNVLANCSVAPKEDYWRCRALKEKNCSLLADDRDYWNCVALTTKNCSLARNKKDYWFCRGVSDKSCSVSPPEMYWICRAIKESNCTLASAKHYWMCRALGKTFN
jgi:hypothetical protein